MANQRVIVIFVEGEEVVKNSRVLYFIILFYDAIPSDRGIDISVIIESFCLWDIIYLWDRFLFVYLIVSVLDNCS